MMPMDGEVIVAELQVSEVDQQQLLEPEADRLQKIKELIGSLCELREAAIKARKPEDDRWVEDMRQLEGYERGYAPDKHRPTGSNEKQAIIPPRLNLTRSRHRVIAARSCDTAFPTNDQAWDLVPTPDPDIDPLMMVDPAGNPIPQELWEIEIQQRCERMRTVIQDQLVAADFVTNGRMFIEDMCAIGTGVFTGPVMASDCRTKFIPRQTSTGQVVMEMSREYKPRPDAKRVDPRKVWFEPVQDFNDCTYAFLLHIMTKGELVGLKKQPGFEQSGEVIDKLSMLEPEQTELHSMITQWNSRLNVSESLKDKYFVWKFDGVLNCEQMETLGLKQVCQPIKEQVIGELWFCQGELLKAKLSPLEGDDRIPYYLCTYEKAADSIYGYGVPYLYRDTQRTINGLWLASQHNASVSSGPLVIVRKSAWIPADGDYTINGPKVIELNDKTSPLGDVVRTEVIANNLEQLLGFLAKAIELGDDEISMPLMANGAPSGEAPSGSGVWFRMLLNNNNIVQRRVITKLDDGLFVPLIKRFYYWNMLYNDRMDIKGEFDPQSRGASVLLVKDIQVSHLLAMKQAVDADPELKIEFKPKVWAKDFFKAADLQYEGYFLSDEESEAKRAQMGQQQEDPQIALKREQLMADIEARKRDDEFKRYDRDLDYKEAELVANSQMIDARSRVLVSQNHLDVELAKMASERDMTIAGLQTKLQMHDRSQETAKILAGQKLQLDAEKLSQADKEMALKLAPQNASGTGI